jgi:hypothetical protein
MAASFVAMFRLAFLVAAIFALFGGRIGDTSVAATSQRADSPAFLADQQDEGPSETGCPSAEVVPEPENESDDDVAVGEEDLTVGHETVASVQPVLGIGVGPAKSHARRMERPPRA